MPALPTRHDDDFGVTGHVRKRPAGAALSRDVRASWATRDVTLRGARRVPCDGRAPRAGDLVVVEVVRVRNHSGIVQATNERLRLYEGVHYVGVLGNRYATDAFAATLGAEPLGTRRALHALTNAGMVGVVRDRASAIKPPTELRFLDYVADAGGARLNLKALCGPPLDTPPPVAVPPVVLVVGSGMNAGKTTTAARLVRQLVVRGRRVAALKMTGSVSDRDLRELRATGAAFVRDFSDYGHPSTFLAPFAELRALQRRMLSAAAAARPEVVVVELADGILQRETAWLLRDPELAGHTAAVVLAAGCALSALAGTDELLGLGHRVACVSGLVTNAPLFVEDLAGRRPDLAVASSAGDGTEIADAVEAAVGSSARGAGRPPHAGDGQGGAAFVVRASDA